MCARITLVSDNAALTEAFPDVKPPDKLSRRYNIAPSQDVAAITNDGSMRVVMLHWGLIPSWAKDSKIGNKMINARAESLPEKPSFRGAYKSRRCVIVADGFYEWHEGPGGVRVPVYIRLCSGLPFGLAGLWEVWEGGGETIRSCTIITTDANELISPVHDRMPVIVGRDNLPRWLDPEPRRPEELGDILAPYPAAEMEAYEVSTFVNSPKNDSPECIEPAG